MHMHMSHVHVHAHVHVHVLRGRLRKHSVVSTAVEEAGDVQQHGDTLRVDAIHVDGWVGPLGTALLVRVGLRLGVGLGLGLAYGAALLHIE